MAGFYYFLPGVEANQVKHPALPVLADCTDADHVTCSPCQRGPNGQPGVVLYPKRSIDPDDLPSTIQHRPEKQTWKQLGGQWIGWLTDSPPAPEDLQRRKAYPGYTVEDEWGRKWSVPIARSSGASLGSLPKFFVFDDAGRPQERLKPQFEHLWAISEKVWDYFNADNAQEVDEAWLIQQAAVALGVNYRLGPAELTAMYEAGVGLLDSETSSRVLLALIDWEVVVDFTKKNAPDASRQQDDSQPSGAGSEDEASTAQAAAS